MKEHCFGIIPIRDEKEVLLIKHKAGHWAFPKGHPVEGEDDLQTAIRELKEETGLMVKDLLKIPPLVETYSFFRGEKIDKTVTYYVATVEGEVILDQNEVVAAEWCSLERAYTLATFETCKQIIKKLQNHPLC